jgi:hypothetical protein
VIRGTAELVQRQLDPTHPSAQNVGRIVRAAEEAVELTRELRGVACADDLPWPD